MKKLYIVTALALAAVFAANAGNCKTGTCGKRKTTIKAPKVVTPTPRPKVAAPAPAPAPVMPTTSWVRSKLSQGTESADKIKMDIEASAAELERKLNNMRAQLKKLTDAGASAARIEKLRADIEALQTNLNELMNIQNCIQLR